MHLSRKGFNLTVLIWLAPAIAMAIYGNTASTGAESDLYFWATGIFGGLAAYATFQFMRDDYTSAGTKARAKTQGGDDDLVSLDNIGALEYLYCAVLCLVAIGSFFYHHHVNKDATGIMAVATLVYSYFDILIAIVSGAQFWQLKATSIKAASKSLISR